MKRNPRYVARALFKDLHVMHFIAYAQLSIALYTSEHDNIHCMLMFRCHAVSLCSFLIIHFQLPLYITGMELRDHMHALGCTCHLQCIYVYNDGNYLVLYYIPRISSI